MVSLTLLLIAISASAASDASPVASPVEGSAASRTLDLRRRENGSLRRQLQVATGAIVPPIASRARSQLSVAIAGATGDEIFWDGFDPCGDGSIDDPAEQCDRADLGGATCSSLGYSSGTLTCNSTCHYDVTQCTVTCSVISCNFDSDCGPAACGPCENLGATGGFCVGAAGSSPEADR